MVTFPGREIKAAQWQRCVGGDLFQRFSYPKLSCRGRSDRVARGYELRITLVDPKDPRKDGMRHQFDNLKREVSFHPSPRSSHRFLFPIKPIVGLTRIGMGLSVGQEYEIAKKAIHGVTNGEIELEHKDISVKGWNWGKMDVRGESTPSP